MSETINVLGIVGSLRRESYNLKTLRAAQALAPAGMTLDACVPGDLPLFSEDWEKTPGPAVVAFKQRVRAADAILFVTPEYNYSISGVLKNAIDCGSRPHGDSAWKGKPCAMLGASTSRLGTARAQYHLRQCLVWLDMPVVLQPEVMISGAAKAFDEQGALLDEKSRELIGTLLSNLAKLVRQVRAA